MADKDKKVKTSEEEADLDEVEELDSDYEEEVEAAPPAAEVEPTEEELEEEEEIIDERIYTVPLRRAYWTGSRLRRSNRAVRILKKFVERHMKPEELLIQPE